MGSKYPVLKPQEIIRALESIGYKYKSKKGSHAKFTKTESYGLARVVIIPMHHEIAKGTLKSILEQAGLTLDEFMSKL